MPYDKVISLGATCTPAWQIRKFTNSDFLLPFDWLDTPFRSLVAVLESDFEGFADSACFQVTPGQRSVINTKVDILHQHDFEYGSDGLITTDWETRVASLPRKYELLIERWRDTLDGLSTVLFVRHEGHIDTTTWRYSDLSIDEMEALCDLIARKYPRISFDVLFVSACASSGVSNHPRVKIAQVGRGENDWTDPADIWKGATREWQELLLKAGQDRASGPAGL